MIVLPRLTNRVSTAKRIDALRMLAEYQTWEDARHTEAVAHAVSHSRAMYLDKMQQIVYNVHTNAMLRDKTNIALMSNEEMATGTIIQDIERESRKQRERFDHILAEKYEKISDSSCKSALRCRRCGNPDVVADQKQTRGADEAMTIFCTCTKCGNRWRMS